MELRHLRYFVAVAEERSFTRAAQRLGIAQPPLSQQIRKLERQLGVLLIERNSRSVTLTAAGTALLQEARVLLSRADETRRIVRQVGDGEAGALRIGSVSSAFSGVLLKLLPAFLDRYPEVTPVVYEMEATPQLEALAHRSIDVAFLRVSKPHPGIQIHTLLNERLVAALPQAHPLARKREVSIGELLREPLVLFPRAAAPEAFDRIISACRREDADPVVAHEASNDHTLVSLVACGLGVSIVPESTSNLALPGVVFRPLVNAIATTPMCLALLDPPLSPAAVSLLQLATDLYSAPEPPTRLPL